MLLELVVCIGVVVAAFLTRQWLSWLFLRLSLRQPGPIPLPLVGNLLYLTSYPSPHRTLHHLSRKYGPIYYLQLGNVTTVVASTPAAAEQILNANDKSLASRPDFKAARRLLYGTDNTTFNCAYGDSWRSTRKFYASKVFAPRCMHELHIPIIAEEIKSIIMSDVYPASRAGAEVDLSRIFSSLTQNIIYRVVLGKRPADISTTLIEDMYRLAHEIERAVGTAQIGEFIPILSFLDYRMNRHTDRCHRIMDAISEGVIAEYEERRSRAPCPAGPADTRNDGLKCTCILEEMLAMNPPFSRNKVKALILELLVGGSTTSSVALESVMVELLRSERAMKRALDEVDNAVGKERMVTMEDVRDKMPYIRAVVKETLRLHPPIPLLIPHMAGEPCELKLGSEGSKACETFRISAGTRVLVNAWAIGRDEAAWGPTASEFAPERFTEGGMMSDVNLRGQHFELLPFGSGCRMCPGLPVATAALELTIASFLHCFRWKTHHMPLDMSEEFGLLVYRRSHLLAVPSPFRLLFPVPVPA